MKKNLAVVVIGIVIALMIIGMRWVRKRWVGDARYMPAVLFAAGGLSWSIASLFRGRVIIILIGALCRLTG